MNLVIDSKAVGKSGFEISGALKSGDPGVFVNEGFLHQDTLIIHPINLDQQRTETLANARRNVLNDS